MRDRLFNGREFGIFGIAFAFLFLCSTINLRAEEPATTNGSIKKLVNQAWEEEGHKDYRSLNNTIGQILKKYQGQAEAMSSELRGFPPENKISSYEIMNAVATALFIRAESLKRQNKYDESIAEFKELMKNFPYGQSWDPSRGAYWSIAEKSQLSIDDMTGVQQQEPIKIVLHSMPVIVRPGEKIVDYSKFGTFTGVGTVNYKYHMKDEFALAKATGEGIYPNIAGIYKNPDYSKFFKEGRLMGNHWDFVNSADIEAAYFKWATAQEDPGVKLFYTAYILEKAKMYMEAIKAYHAVIVQFPNTVSWTYWNTKWYPAQVAVYKIKFIIRMHPELHLRYIGGKVRVNIEAGQTIIETTPGYLKRGRQEKQSLIKDLGKPIRILGGKKTQLVQYANGHWRMFVDGNPYMIHGITYSPAKVGESPDEGTLENWMTEDTRVPGKPDAPYFAYVDKDDHNTQHPNEVPIGDFELMKEMGVNTLRLYHQPFKVDKTVLMNMYKTYGIRVLMGDYLGKFTLGSGADWATGTNYDDLIQQATMMKSVEEMVTEFRDEPYILMWVLGNENVYGVGCNADKKPDSYFKFVNKVAKLIHELDPDRPVAMVNGDTLYIDKFAKDAPNVDVFSANVYRGDYGFGSFWDDVHRYVNKPVYITEFGAPGYSKQVSIEEAEQQQAEYDEGNWLDILGNSASYPDGEGNAIGGSAFDWLDEWWKNYGPSVHNTNVDATGPFPGGYYYEEWFGLTGQGDGKDSPFKRHLKAAYFMFKKLWNQ